MDHLAKATLAYLPSAQFVAPKSPFPFWQTQYVQVFSLKTVPFCKLFAGSGCTNKSVISLLPSLRLLLCPLLHHCFYLKLSGRSDRNGLLSPSLLSGYNRFPVTCFFWGTTRLMSWSDGERYSCPLQSLVVSLFDLWYPLFSQAGGVLSHLNSSTHRSPWSPPRNFYSLVTLAVSSLVFTARDRAFC